MNFYAMAIHSFQESLNGMERHGQKDTLESHLANGLLRLTQGLEQIREEEEDRRKSYARIWTPPKSGAASAARV